MGEEFINPDVKRVMDKLMSRMQESGVQFSSTISHAKTTDDSKIPENESLDDPSSSPLKSKTMTAKEFQEITLARMNGIKLKSQEKLKVIEEETKKKELKELKKKPEINKNSQKLGKRDEKIYDRVEKEMKESTKALERVKEKLEKERNDKVKGDLTFAPKLIKGGAKKKRSKEEFFQYTKEWVDKVSKKKEKKKEEIDSKLNEDLKFTPVIDNNSANIVQGLGSRKPIEERAMEKLEFNKKKVQALRDEQIPSFVPTIEENSRAIAKHKFEGNVFDRLFWASKRDSTPKHHNEKADMKRNRSFSFSNDIEEDQHNNLDFLFDLSS
jgi:hypothetical protein